MTISLSKLKADHRHPISHNVTGIFATHNASDALIAIAEASLAYLQANVIHQSILSNMHTAMNNEQYQAAARSASESGRKLDAAYDVMCTALAKVTW